MRQNCSLIDALKLSIPVDRAGALSEGWTPIDRQGKGGNRVDYATEQSKSYGWRQGAVSPCRLLSTLSFQKTAHYLSKRH